MSRKFSQSGYEYATAMSGHTEKADDLIGSDESDFLRGGQGDDTLTGGAGDDQLWGNRDNDELHGGAGDDRLGGGWGNDTLFGDEGDDRLFGARGDDSLNGGQGDDRLFGGKGNDSLDGGEGNDRMFGGHDQDHLSGGTGEDTLYGGTGNDTLAGGDGNDRMFGGTGDDTGQFAGTILDFVWEDKNSVWMKVTDTAGNGGTDMLHSIENLAFDDYTLDLDGDNAALVKGQEATTDEDTAGEFTISAWDFDDGTPEMTSYSVTGGGSLSLVSEGTNDRTPMAEGHDFTFAFDPGDAYQHLAEGETATETVTFEVADGQGNTTTYEQDVTITGVNDAPEFAETSGAAEVTEDGETTITGSVSASDVDSNDTLTYAVENGGTGLYGTLSVDDEGNWTYELDNESAAVQALEAGEEASETFRIAVMDNNGGEDFYELSVNVIGTADVDPAVTLDFEDLEVEIGALAPMPEGYMGFDWSNAGYFLETDEFRGGEGTPYHTGATSGDNVVYNNASDDLTISRDEAFDLESANFISTSRSEMELTVTGYLDGEATGSQTFLLSNEHVTEADFDDAIFDEVDSVTFSSEFDVLGRFVMDDLEFIA